MSDAAEITVSQRFTAWARCPSCERIDCHQIRPPRPAPSAADLAAWRRKRRVCEVQQWGATRPVRTIYDPPRPVDESPFEVIRICECGREWGQL